MGGLLRLLPYVRRSWWWVLLAQLQVIVVAAFGLVAPLVVEWVIDTVLGAGRWHLLLPGSLAVVAVAVVMGAARFGQRYAMERAAQDIVFRLRSDLYRQLLRLSFAYYDRARTGELMSRVTSDVELLRHALGMGLANGVYHLATALGVGAVLMYKHWSLALVSMAFVPPLLFTVRQFTRQVRPAQNAVQEETARLTATLQEYVSGVRVVRSFAQEEREAARFEERNQQYLAASIHSSRLQALYGGAMNFLSAAGLVLVLWYGGRLAAAGAITVGGLVAFNSYLGMLVWPIRMLGFLVGLYARAAAGAQRVFELLDTQPDVHEAPGARPLPPLTGEVVLEEVSLSYDGEHQVLDRVNLRVRPGQRVALLGATGSGKSSLVHLLPRFYDPSAGRVLLDGIDVKGVTLDSLRRQVAVVMQESFLFSTSLRENIAYGRPDASQEEIEAAARDAQIHDFIVSLPGGYDAVVGERGVGLSGGQRQRVAIARALLTGAPILVLDESTAAVDVGTEQRLKAAFDRVMAGRTAFVIAKRLSTVLGADLVVVLDQGRIVEQGNHAELLALGGLYRQIYAEQLATSEQEGVAAS